MISVERLKKILNNPKMSDQQVEVVRDELAALAKIIFQKWLQERNASKEKLLKNNDYDN